MVARSFGVFLFSISSIDCSIYRYVIKNLSPYPAFPKTTCPSQLFVLSEIIDKFACACQAGIMMKTHGNLDFLGLSSNAKVMILP
jgi:hypothetical protein